ncbi:MAG TPA: hypothetical protein VHV55_23515 [Pirellulales bacterium]|jgi:hypothetical protein|nr:hypothetical protein [Pirellulales bacterium]
MRWASFFDYLGNPGPRVIFWVALTAVLCALGMYAIAGIRRAFRESAPDASGLITNFRDLHGRGELSDEEYRTIKATLAERLRRQLDKPALDKPEPKLESFEEDTEDDD